MATVVTPGTVKDPERSANCDYCGNAQVSDGMTIDGEFTPSINGFVINVEFNYGDGPYAYYGRCFRCNHRDRG